MIIVASAYSDIHSLPVLHSSEQSLAAHLLESVETTVLLVECHFCVPYEHVCRDTASTKNK